MFASEGCISQVYCEQARAASLAETVGTTTPAFLLRRVYYVASMSWLLSANMNRDRFTKNQLAHSTTYNLSASYIKQVIVGAELDKNGNITARVKLMSSHKHSYL